jgi:hypothetical protein
MRSSGRGRTGKPFLVAPNGHAAWRHNNEQPDRKTSCSAVSGRHGQGGRGRGGGTSYNGQGDEEEAVPPTSITINLLTLAVLVFTMFKLATQQLMSWLWEQLLMLTWTINLN